MRNGRSWSQTAIALMLLAAGLLSIPQTAEARDKCRNKGNRGSSYGYNDRGYNPGYGQRGGYYGGGYSASSPYYGNSSAWPNSRGTYNSGPYYSGNDPYYGGYSEPRSAGKSAAIIGGGAGVGAAVGAMTGGKKGALIGGALGAVGGLVYDRTTRNDPNRSW